MRGHALRGGPLQPQCLPALLGRAQVQHHQQPDLCCLPQQGGHRAEGCAPAPPQMSGGGRGGLGAGPCLAQGGKARHGSPSMGSQTSQIRVQRGSDPLPERRALTWGRLVHCGCLAAPGLWPPDANSTPRQCHESPGAAWPGGAPCSGAGGPGDLQDAVHVLPGPGCDPVIGVQ